MSYPDERLTKIQHLNRQEGFKLVYEWVKTGVIDFTEFMTLINNVSAL